jgi:hypothetical protein
MLSDLRDFSDSDFSRLLIEIERMAKPNRQAFFGKLQFMLEKFPKNSLELLKVVAEKTPAAMAEMTAEDQGAVIATFEWEVKAVETLLATTKEGKEKAATAEALKLLKSLVENAKAKLPVALNATPIAGATAPAAATASTSPAAPQPGASKPREAPKPWHIAVIVSVSIAVLVGALAVLVLRQQ